MTSLISSLRRLILSACLALCLSGCGLLQSKPVPEAYKNFVGAWQTQGATLNIYSGGRLEYESSTRKLSAPIQEWSQTGFNAGLFGIGGDFVVSEAPHLVGGQWQMVVDGERYIRIKP